MFLREIKVRRKSGKVYRWWVVIKTYWDKEKKKVRHRVIHNLGRLTEKEVNILKTLISLKDISEDSFITSLGEIKIKGSYEYLIVVILDKLWYLWGLDKITDFKNTGKLSYSFISKVLVLNRAISPASDLRVCDWYKETILEKLYKVDSSLVNPTRIYRTLDKLFTREKEIQRHIREKIEALGLDDFRLVFYDITSSWFEGGRCSLAEYGLSRDKRKDKKQLLLALGVTKQGYPFYWKVLPGSIHDCLTVCEAIDSFKREEGIENFIVVMDKGMVSNDNLKYLEENKLFYIVSIGRHQIRRLSGFPSVLLKELGERIEKGEDINRIMEEYPYFTYFSERAYYHQLETEGKRRYILCFNPEKFLEERHQREEKIKSINQYLTKLNEKLKKAKRTKDKKIIEKEIYTYLKKREAERYFNIKVIGRKKKGLTIYQINWEINEEKLNRIKITDGLWGIVTNLDKDKSADFLISCYLSRRKVESAFHYLKGFIEIRPFYHHKEDRIKSHILVCILSYFLQITLENLLKKKGYNFTFREFVNKVREVKAVELEVKNVKKRDIKLTEIQEEIKRILKDLNMEDLMYENFIKNLI